MIRQTHLLKVLIFLSFFLSVQAQEVWLRNRPFEGKVLKDSGQIWLEVEPFGKALGFGYELKEDGVAINGKLVRSLTQGTKVFVPLSQSAAVLGAVVKENPEFGTVDVHLDVKSSQGAGLDVDLAALSENTKPVVGQIIKTAAFEFTVPDTMQITRDPRMIKKTLEIDPTKKGSEKVDALMFFKGDSRNERGAAIFAWEDFEAPTKDEQTLLSVQRQVLLDTFFRVGVDPVDAVPPYLTNGSQSFALLTGLMAVPPHDGVLMLTRIDSKKNRLYKVTVLGIPSDDEPAINAFTSLLKTITTR